MPVIEWSDRFVLGIEEFDGHHLRLVTLLNAAYDAFGNETALVNVEKVVAELVDYATYHFACEERWMESVSYANFEEHRSEHRRFARRVLEIQKDIQCRRTKLNLELLAFMKNWITDHILKTDVAYAHAVSNRPEPGGVNISLE